MPIGPGVTGFAGPCEWQQLVVSTDFESNFSRQCEQQKKYVVPSRVADSAVAGSTIIPQIGSLVSSLILFSGVFLDGQIWIRLAESANVPSKRRSFFYTKDHRSPSINALMIEQPSIGPHGPCQSDHRGLIRLC